jgi:hypothetical protein
MSKYQTINHPLETVPVTARFWGWVPVTARSMSKALWREISAGLFYFSFLSEENKMYGNERANSWIKKKTIF